MTAAFYGLKNTFRISAIFMINSFRHLRKMSSTNSTCGIAAVVQLNCNADKDANFEQAKKLLQKAKSLGAQMAFLPENCDFMAENKEETLARAEFIDGNFVKKFQDMARQLNMWISLGSIHEKLADDPGRIRNTHIMLDSEGTVRGLYHKLHLFSVDIPGSVQLNEAAGCRPGTHITPPIATPIGNVAMSICYDLRFPEQSLAQRALGAEILTYPSAFTVPTGYAHWEVLLRSRAIETQCYVIAAAQVGRNTSKRTTYGHAMIVDPWGCKVAECRDEVGVCVAEIDLKYLTQKRVELPVWSHRRLDVYPSTLGTVSRMGDIDSQELYQFGAHTIDKSCVFFRTALSYAFVNRKPVVPGHVLISPLRPALRVTDLSACECADLMQVAQLVSRTLERVYNSTALTFGIQDGADAGQTVQHVHVHVLPRKPGDFKRNDDVYSELEKHDKGAAATDARLWRSLEEMSAEAATLRKHFQ